MLHKGLGWIGEGCRTIGVSPKLSLVQPKFRVQGFGVWVWGVGVCSGVQGLVLRVGVLGV